MKIHFSAIGFICVTFMLTGLSIVSAADIKKCYKCPANISLCADRTKLVEQECIAGTPKPKTGTPSSTKVNDTDTPASGETFVERKDAGTDSAAKWKCVTITGKNKENKNPATYRACMMDGCAGDHGMKDAFDDYKCEDCDSKDLCNSSARFSPIGWISLLITIICFGSEY